MSASRNELAFLTNLAGAHLPPVLLNVAAAFQYCVDAGAMAAVRFFDEATAIGLHDHIAVSMRDFSSSVRVGMAVADVFSSDTMQSCVDAFAAGYLGRIQQELRLFQGKHVGRDSSTMDAGLFRRQRVQH